MSKRKKYERPKGCLPLTFVLVGEMILLFVCMNILITTFRILAIGFIKIDLADIIFSLFFEIIPIGFIGLSLVHVFPTIHFEERGIIVYGFRLPLKYKIVWEDVYEICELDSSIFKGFFALLIKKKRKHNISSLLFYESMVGKLLGFSYPVVLLSPKLPSLQKIISIVGTGDERLTN